MHFAWITPEGGLEGNRYHIAIWTEETRWREVRVRFDPRARVRSVVTVNPVSQHDDGLNDPL